MEKNKTYIINIIIGVVVIAALGLGYYFFFYEEAEERTIEIQLTESQLTQQQIFKLINDLGNIKLDRDIVLKEDFVNLKDFTQEIPEQPTGVSNPFRPINF